MHDRNDRSARLQRLRREGRRLDDQKPLGPWRAIPEEAEGRFAAAIDLVVRFGG